jgi:hypothetical protein
MAGRNMIWHGARANSQLNNRGKPNNEAKSNNSDKSVIHLSDIFQLLPVDSITGSKQRAAYLVRHKWRLCNSMDSIGYKREIGKQSFGGKVFSQSSGSGRVRQNKKRE